MRFDRESYRKLYVAESAEHQLMALVSRGLRDYLLRFASEDGTLLPGTTDPVGDMMVVLRARPSDRKFVTSMLTDLQRVGYLKLERKRLWIVKYEEAQEARTPGALRQKKLRDKKRGGGESGGGGEQPESVTECVTGAVTPSVTSNANSDAHVTSPLADETRRDVAAVTLDGGKVPCPPDLDLTPDQRATLETSLIPGWAVDQIRVSFLASERADLSKTMPLLAWRKCLAKAVTRTWQNPNQRPRKPATEASAPVPFEQTAAGRTLAEAFSSSEAS